MPVITISRQFGAGGKTIGDMIAKKTGYTFLDHDLIQKVAEKAKVSTSWVEDMEKEAGGKLLKFISGLISRNTIDKILGSDKGYIDEEIGSRSFQTDNLLLYESINILMRFSCIASFLLKESVFRSVAGHL